MVKVYKTSEELDRIITKEFLLSHALSDGTIPISKIGKIVDCDDSTIVRRILKFGLRTPTIGSYTNTNKKVLSVNKEWLIEQYYTKDIPIYKLAKSLNCSQEIVRRTILKLGITLKNSKRLTKKELKKKLTKEFLWENLVTKNLDSYQVGKLVPCDASTIRDYARKHKVPIKSVGEALKGKKPNYKDPAGRLKKILSKVQASPNNFEKKCLEHLNKLYPKQFKYTGDGSLIVNGRSADAYSKKLNIVVLFHGVYWHLLKDKLEITEENKRAVEKIDSLPFLQAGYKVMFIWENELEKVIKYYE